MCFHPLTFTLANSNKRSQHVTSRECSNLPSNQPLQLVRHQLIHAATLNCASSAKSGVNACASMPPFLVWHHLQSDHASVYERSSPALLTSTDLACGHTRPQHASSLASAQQQTTSSWSDCFDCFSLAAGSYNCNMPPSFIVALLRDSSIGL